MSQARLDIRADARELSTASRVMRRFGVAGMRAGRTIKREMRDVNREIRTLTQEQKLLTAEMLKVEKGGEAYKKLKTELKGVKGALKEARGEARDLGTQMGKTTQGAMRSAGRGASYARVTAQQMLGAIGGAGPEQTYATMGQFSGMIGTALSNVPVVGAAFGLVGAAAQAGLNVMQRRTSMLVSAQRARQQAGAYVRGGIGEESVVGMARTAARQGYGVEEAYGIMRAFGQGAGYRAGAGVLEMQRMGFGPGAMGGAALYAPGFGGMGVGRTTSLERGRAGKNLLRQVAAQTRLESRLLIGKGAERTITPATVEQRLTEMVTYLKQMALEGVAVDPKEFQNETMRVFSLGLQTQNRELFAGGRAFRFQTAMREGQRQEGGILNMMAIMTGMQRGQDVIGAMESARLGRVPLGQMQEIMQRMGVGSQRWLQFMIGKQIGRPMEEVAALAGGQLGMVPEAYPGMARKGGGALDIWRRAAPVSEFQRGLLEVRAEEMEAAKGSATAMINTARSLIEVQTKLAQVGASAHNVLIDIASMIHYEVKAVADFLHQMGISEVTIPAVDYSSMKIPGAGGAGTKTRGAGMIRLPIIGEVGGTLKGKKPTRLMEKIKRKGGWHDMPPPSMR